jgi:phosphatidate cytidylyltransferase
VLAPLLIALVLLGPIWGLQTLFVVAGLLAIDEAVRIASPASPYRAGDRALAVFVSAGLLIGTAVGGPDMMGLAFGICVTSAMTGILFRLGDVKQAGPRVLAVLGGVAYAGGLFAVVLHFGFLGDRLARAGVMLLFLTVWLGDSAAYFAGKALGRHKLAPVVSPKKTWEGAAGGWAGSVLGAAIGGLWFFPDWDLGTWIVVGTAAAVTEQVGDLAESLLKRAYGVKDSGTLLPGHGGMLDRVDGMLFAAPAVYACVRAWG